MIRSRAQFIHCYQSGFNELDFLSHYNARYQPVQKATDGCYGYSHQPEPDKDEYDFIEEIDWQCTHDGVRLDIPQYSYVHIAHSNSRKSPGI